MPEAPRTIWDAVASENQLPFHFQVRGEFEYVKAKPLGDGFTGVPFARSGSGAAPIPREPHVNRGELSARRRIHWSDDGDSCAPNRSISVRARRWGPFEILRQSELDLLL